MDLRGLSCCDWYYDRYNGPSCVTVLASLRILAVRAQLRSLFNSTLRSSARYLADNEVMQSQLLLYTLVAVSISHCAELQFFIGCFNRDSVTPWISRFNPFYRLVDDRQS